MADMEASERVYANLYFVIISFFFSLDMSKYWSWHTVQNLISFLNVFCINAYVTESRVLIWGVLYFLFF